MDRFDLDRFTIDYIYRLYKDNRLNLRPDYQRGRVWNDEERYALIESIKEEFPIGLIMWNVVEHVDADGIKVERYDVVDGQQRVTTVVEYVDGTSWATSSRRESFEPFAQLSSGRKTRFWQYRVPVASMKGFEPDEIAECYNRLQRGKPLKIGEKLKSMTTSPFHMFVKELAKHRLFDLAGGRLKTRDGHWTLSVAFLKSIYAGELFARQEYKHLSDFVRSQVSEKKVQKSIEECRRILNLEAKILELAVKEQSEFDKYVGTPRAIKWLFVSLASLIETYSVHGREHLMAKGVLKYYRLIAQEGSAEWMAYVNTGRTGRIDTDEVRICLGDLTNQTILAAKAEPLDPKRFFSPEMRDLIYKNSGGQCQVCQIELSPDNFHADHIRPHSQGGPTIVSNGRALCSKCNHEKGSTWKELLAGEAV